MSPPRFTIDCGQAWTSTKIESTPGLPGYNNRLCSPTLGFMKRVKLADVARAAGVHPGTASRALNPATRDQVSKATSRRVERAAERLGYVPNPLARGLRTARSYITAMVVPDVTNPLFPPMVRGAEQVLS